MQVVEAGLTRDGKHLRMRCNCMGKHFWCIGFNMADCIPNKGDMLDIAFNLDLNEYNGTKDINLIVKDIHKQ